MLWPVGADDWLQGRRARRRGRFRSFSARSYNLSGKSRVAECVCAMPEKTRSRLNTVLKMGLLPVVFYLACFVLLTYPLILRFSTHFFADNGDGLIGIWDLWWVNKAVIDLHQLPWHTAYVGYPFGVSLLGHTLTPINGFLAIPLLRAMPLVESFNTVVVFSFVATGYTMFLLAHQISRSYWGSLAAGYIFTFSSYHFAHAQGHLNLVTLEWIPLFLLLWYLLLVRPNTAVGLGAGLVLFAVLLSDYQYFLYCVIAAAIMAVWYALHTRQPVFLFDRGHRGSLVAFVAVSLLTAAPLVLATLQLQRVDPLQTVYVPEQYSLDLLSLLIPGGRWRFASLTESYWSRLPGNINETSVFLGISVIVLVVFVWIKRRDLSVPSLILWYFLLIFFAIMSLGPVLQIWGDQVLPSVSLPYDWLFQRLFPPLRVYRVPVRMVVMVVLSAALIASIGLQRLFSGSRRERFLAVFLLALLVVEYLPGPLPASQPVVPGQVQVLKDLPGQDAVADAGYGVIRALYYQTIHQRPIAFGHVSRMPASAAAREQQMRQVLASGEYERLCRDYGIRYLVIKRAKDSRSASLARLPVLYQDDLVRLYDLGGEGACQIRMAAEAQLVD